VIETAYNYAMSDDQKMLGALKSAAKKGIGLVAMKTQCSQYWYRENVPSAKLEFYKGKIMHTAVLKWALKNDYISTAIPGYTNFQQMEEDISVARDLDYAPEEKQFLEDKNVKLSLGYCRQCDTCLASCPKGVEIPALMRTHMYAACYGNLSQARDTIDEVPEGRGLDACAVCDNCSAKCAHNIDIARRIEDLKITYTGDGIS
jgi:predicted aldo/keto reductase-like oxidoreductase